MAGLKEKTRERLEDLFLYYPDRPAALIPALFLVQEEQNHLTEESLDDLADVIGMPKSTIYETATFYSLFSFEPQGKHIIRICRNICCFLRGSDKILAGIEKVLGVGVDETTPDGLFTLQVVECLAACDRAPAMMIDEKTYGPLKTEDLEDIFGEYR